MRVFSSPGSPEPRLLLLLFPAGLLFPLSSHPAVFTWQIKLQDMFKSKQLSTHISAFLGHVASPRTLTDDTFIFSKRGDATLMEGFFFLTRLSIDVVPIKSSSSSGSKARRLALVVGWADLAVFFLPLVLQLHSIRQD